MASIKLCNLILLLLFTLLLPAPYVVQGSRTQVILPPLYHQNLSSSSSPVHYKGSIANEENMKRNSRRLMIGSTAPTCTYNECRGCKYKCRAEQVPVEGNDPINSAYHYKCVCHR
ncbi:Epidermal patterning factor-like protein 9 [Melia azedarach]|uniref:Epidermal patterning factor-like protein 9 n=1 Tax=Melia azedarach TaxID=155640 RepID=A0ACC1Z0U1_MELAZ|nr:Epidermal patterning factor-like protein 9 [Melia azedarach]